MDAGRQKNIHKDRYELPAIVCTPTSAGMKYLIIQHHRKTLTD